MQVVCKSSAARLLSHIRIGSATTAFLIRTTATFRHKRTPQNDLKLLEPMPMTGPQPTTSDPLQLHLDLFFKLSILFLHCSTVLYVDLLPPPVPHRSLTISATSSQSLLSGFEKTRDGRVAPLLAVLPIVTRCDAVSCPLEDSASCWGSGLVRTPVRVVGKGRGKKSPLLRWGESIVSRGAAARGGERRSRSEGNRRRKPLGLGFEIEKNGRKETTAFEVNGDCTVDIESSQIEPPLKSSYPSKREADGAVQRDDKSDLSVSITVMADDLVSSNPIDRVCETLCPLRMRDGGCRWPDAGCAQLGSQFVGLKANYEAFDKLSIYDSYFQPK
ncbi:hypothetical protein Prudu_006015 [Prunus dulcis]|uniref:Uncharacterized protein n=1 Tax=Prunus dulcis TaxID=3755 RepID=A0A4Y1QYX1_PRUDU|nr:hypothetical protein Prudu_006015 [Prunus dulcis]